VAGGYRHAKLVQLELGFRDASLDPLGNTAEVMILELLPAGWRGADEGAATHHEIGAHGEMRAVDQEVFLLGTEGGVDALHSLVTEELEQGDRLL